MLRNLDISLRSLIRRPGMTLLCVLTIAVGIGSNTAVFSIVHAVLINPLPYEDSDRLVTVWQTMPEWIDSDNPFYQAYGSRFPVAYPVYEDWLRMNPVFEDLAAYSPGDYTVVGGDRPEQLRGLATSGSLFRTLGIEPSVGRGFSAGEDRRGGDRVAILSDGYWRRAFGADPDVLGQNIRLNDVPHTIVGVMPRGFFFPSPAYEFWVPFVDEDRHSDRDSQSLAVVARLRPGVDVEQAQAEMEGVTGRIREIHPEPATGVRVVPHIEEMVGKVRKPLLLLALAGGLLLLVAAVNVANLLLIRATERHRDIATQLALGSRRRHIVRQLLLDSAVLTATGAVAGVLLAVWSLDYLKTMLPERMPRLGEIGIDASVLGFTAVVSVFVAIAFGLVPVLGASRLNLARALQDTTGTASRSRSRGLAQAGLVVIEVAVTVVLLVAAGLLLNSYLRLQSVHPGIDPTNVLTVEISPSEDRHPDLELFYRQVAERLSSLPGVLNYAEAAPLPLSGDSSTGVVAVEGVHSASDNGVEVLWGTITPQYFETLGIPVLRGREFEPMDDGDAPLVVAVNESMARAFWPDGDPIGRRIDLEGPGEGDWAEVVAVVGDVRQSDLRHEPKAKIYTPFAQSDEDERTVVLRTESDALALVPTVREAVWEVDPTVPFTEIATMEEVLADRLAQDRFRTTLLGILAAMTVLLAVVGIYGLVSYSVAQRTREIGMCRALGADSRDVLRMVLTRSMSLVLLGELVGVVLALVGSRVLSGMLFEIEGTDPLTFVLIVVALALVALLAAMVPARRATRVEPMAALRVG